MKRKIYLLLPLLILMAILGGIVSTYASPATSYTYTRNNRGQLVRTQDAYLPQLTITWLGLSNPTDIFIDQDDLIYIADAGNRRILIYQIADGQVVNEITHDRLRNPQGLFVRDGLIYVADPQSEAVLVFNTDGELVDYFGRPTAVAFGETLFRPVKIAVDRTGNMFVIGEGVYHGIIQLSSSGEFLGYFASNRVQLTLTQILQDIFFTEAQMANVLSRLPVTFSNVFIDSEGIVYSTTAAHMPEAIKKHNTAGVNMLNPMLYVATPPDAVDIHVDAQGIIYVASLSGQVYVYSTDGEFIFIFGASNRSADISGLFSSLVSISTDSQGNIWTLDGEKSFLQSFTPTPFARNTYAALAAYEDGLYQKAITIWNEVLRENQMSVLAHAAMARNHFASQEFEQARHHARIAGNRFYYSQSFWEVRNDWIQSHLYLGIIGGAALYAIYLPLKIVDKKTEKFKNVKAKISKIKENAFVKQVAFTKLFFKKPIDAYYYLKRGERGSVIGAVIILLLAFAAYMYNLIGKGFIFQFLNVEQVDFTAVIIGFFAIVLLFVICNYLVTSITDGEGGLLQIFKMTSYSLLPLIIGLTLATILTHVVTRDERFFVDLVTSVAYLWTGLNILLGVIETHNYTIRVAAKSIFITVVLMVIIAVALIIVMLMSGQVFDFFEGATREVWRNVSS